MKRITEVINSEKDNKTSNTTNNFSEVTEPEIQKISQPLNFTEPKATSSATETPTENINRNFRLARPTVRGVSA